MTSEAKIGLLLGLVVIVIIALVVNGLPSFHKNNSNNDLTTETVQLDNPAGAIGANERQVSQNLMNLTPQPQAAEGGLQPPSQQTINEVRSISNPPQPNLTSPVILANQGNSSGTQEQVTTNSQQQPTRQTPLPRTVTETTKTYVVKSGDSLSSIAIQFYGKTEGNRLVNIDRIYNANKNVLKSRDAIYEGQKLVIPPLPESQTTSTTTIRTATASLSGSSASGTFVGPPQPANTVEYTVEDGDNLWKIAEAKLGNGIRYTEIVKLNPVLEKNQDNLKVGMKLKLPLK